MSMNDFSKIKQALSKKCKTLDIYDGDDLLAVACCLADLLDNFNTILEEENENLDPFSQIHESQYTKIHRLFRKILKRDHGFNFQEADFKALKKYTRALIAGLLGLGLFAKTEKLRNND